jgi:hypothetical protein
VRNGGGEVVGVWGKPEGSAKGIDSALVVGHGDGEGVLAV